MNFTSEESERRKKYTLFILLEEMNNARACMCCSCVVCLEQFFSYDRLSHLVLPLIKLWIVIVEVLLVPVLRTTYVFVRSGRKWWVLLSVRGLHSSGKIVPNKKEIYLRTTIQIDHRMSSMSDLKFFRNDHVGTIGIGKLT